MTAFDELCEKVKRGWYPKNETEWRTFWILYAKMLLAGDPRVEILR